MCNAGTSLAPNWIKIEGAVVAKTSRKRSIVLSNFLLKIVRHFCKGYWRILILDGET